MPRKRDRTRLRQLLDRIDREIKQRRKKELEEHRRFLRKYLEESFRNYVERDREANKNIAEEAYLRWYESVYKNIRFRVVRYSVNKANRSVGKRDYVDTTEKRDMQRRSMFTWLRIFGRRLLDELVQEIHRFPPVAIARAIRNSVEIYRTIHDIRNGRAFIPIVTIWKDRYLELYIDQSIDQWLQDPERIEATMEALSYIFKQLLSTKQRIVMPPETYERLKGILRLLYRYYVSYSRPMPCRRTQMMIKLTPLTIHYFRGYAARLYIVRWIRTDSLSSGLLTVTRNIDIHFIYFRKYKYKGETVSTMTIAADTDYLQRDTPLYLWRDAQQLPRELLYLYEAIYLYHRIEDGLKRAIGKREIDASLGHCSIYAGFRRFSPYKSYLLKRVDREKYRVYRWD